MTAGMVPWETFDEVVRQALVNRAKLDRIAALCDVPWEQGGIPAIWNMQVRAILHSEDPS